MYYFRILTDDERYGDRWLLDEPRSGFGKEIDAREFTYGRPYAGLEPKDLPVYHHGPPVAFHMAAFDMPVVTAEVGGIIARLACADIERYPVTVDGKQSGYVILNVTRQEACVDKARTEVTRWTAEDNPERAGRLRVLGNLHIDPTRTRGAHIFRVEDFVIALIVSEVMKEALEQVPDLGIIFKPVC